jgi:hypothetical protein
MNNPVHLKRQRGELSLFWCVVLFVAVSLIMMTFLMSFRYNRNLFADAWNTIVAPSATEVGNKIKAVTATEPAAASVPLAGEVRKCTIKGKVVYSNVECGTDNPTSRKVDVRPSEGMSPNGPAPAAKPAAK